MIGAATSSGPAFTVHGWIAWILIAGGLAAAWVTVWKAVVPVVRMAALFLSTWPILEDIATAFRPDGHLSLPDTIRKISADLTVVEAKVTDVRHSVIDVAGLRNLSAALGTVPTIVGALTALASEVKALRATNPPTQGST